MTHSRGFARMAQAALLNAGIVAVLHAQASRPRTIATESDSAARADAVRAAMLFVSSRPEDLPQRDHDVDVREKAVADAMFVERTRGVMDYAKITYRSGADGMSIPAYVFQPLQKRGTRGHAALVYVHGGVHSDFGPLPFLPFVRDAVARGYVVIAPDFRGSTGYGAEFYNAIDYGGKEVDDVMSAVDYLRTLPHVDPERIGIIGWSHGGLIAAHALFRNRQPFKAGSAIVPVTNLVFRLSYKGPEYQREFAAQSGIQGLPFERPSEYIRRSPVYFVDNLAVPMLVHVATNDQDVDFVEDEQMINALRAKKPNLAETKVYVDPPGGHAFSLLMNPKTLEATNTPAQRDSWRRIWAFFERTLHPEEPTHRGDHR